MKIFFVILSFVFGSPVFASYLFSVDSTNKKETSCNFYSPVPFSSWDKIIASEGGTLVREFKGQNGDIVGKEYTFGTDEVKIVATTVNDCEKLRLQAISNLSH